MHFARVAPTGTGWCGGASWRGGASTTSASGSGARPTSRPTRCVEVARAPARASPSATSRAWAPSCWPGSCRASTRRCSTRCTRHQDAGRATFIVSAAGNELVADARPGARHGRRDRDAATRSARTARSPGRIDGAVRLRRGQGGGDAALRGRARDRPGRLLGLLGLGSPTCRCCARSATRSPSTPTSASPRSPGRGVAGDALRALGRRLAIAGAAALAAAVGGCQAGDRRAPA